MARPPVNPFARFEKKTDIITPRLIARVAGEVGSGKTSWALGAPGPIVVQTLDQGLEGVVEPFTKQKDIYVANYDIGVEVGSDITHAMAVALMEKWNADFEDIIVQRAARTVIWDRESDLWNWHVFAETGTDDKFAAAKAKEWPKIKGKIRRLVAMLKATDMNMVIIQGMRNEWGKSINPRTGNETSTPTGNRIPDGMEEIEADVHTNLILDRVDHKDEPSTFTMRVGKTRGPGATSVQGQTFDPALSFVELACMLYPDSTEEDWQ